MSTGPTLALAIALATLASAASVVSAQIPLRVRAETRLELRVDADESGVRLGGTLRDDLGAPLEDRSIDVHVEGDAARRSTVRTDSAGHFELRLEAPTGEMLVRAEFEGDAYHDGTEAARTVRQGLEDVRLALAVPGGGVFDLDVRRHPVTIVARGSSGPARVRVELFDELGRRLGDGATNELGRLRLALTDSLLGPPGAGRLVARSSSDARFAASQTEVPIVRLRPTRIELRASPAAAHADEPIRLEGRLYGSDGARKHEAVGIFLDERHVATVLTDDHGAFRAEAALRPTEETTAAFSARFEPNGPGHGPAASAPAIVRVLSPSPHRWVLRVAPPLVLLLLWAAARWLRAGSDRIAARRLVGGRAPARRSLPFGPRVEAIRGIVVGEVDTPIAGAIVRYAHASGPTGSVGSDAEGRFALPELPRGDVDLAVAAVGYAETTSRLALPVRARGAELVLRLRSLRSVALAAYKQTAEHWLDSPEDWPTTTNPTAATRAPSTVRDAATDLALAIDRVYYGPGPADATEVEKIVRSAEEQRNNAEPLHRTR